MGLGLAQFVDGRLAVIGAVGLCLLTIVRLSMTVHDRRRPAWVTRLVDEPLFAHWGAAVLSLGFGLPLFIVAAVAPNLASWPAMAVSAYAVGLGVAAWGIWVTRRRVQVRRVEVPLVGLPRALEGYRIVHLSDLHIGSYDPVATGLRWVRLANSLRADLAVVTGDLVTSGTRFYPDVAEVIGALRAGDGTWVSMGNHDQWDEEALVQAIEGRGARVLRNEAVGIERAGNRFFLAGLGDAYTGKDDLDATLARCDAEPTVLMAHYPRFFDDARRRGVGLVLSGHTHGGQFGVPGWAGRLNVATALGQPSAGLFEEQGAYLCVSAGLGTTGPPMRIGVRPEIVEITLRVAAPARTAEQTAAAAAGASH